MKQAFLIIAHHQYDILKTLVKLLDNVSTDIYIHIDKKSSLPQNLETIHSKLFLLKKRIDVRWGDYSQIQTELLLFKTAYNNGPYLYYHLLSGVDLPIKPINYIISFFEKNKGKEFIGFVKEESWLYKINSFHFFTKYYHTKGWFSQLFINKLKETSENLFIKYFPRKTYHITYKKGCNWCSITNDFCHYLLKQEKFIRKRYKFTFCADEIFIQSVIWNSQYKKNIYSIEDEYESCMREIDWKRGTPYTWSNTAKDIDLLKKSKKLFARKFGLNHNLIIKELQITNSIL